MFATTTIVNKGIWNEEIYAGNNLVDIIVCFCKQSGEIDFSV